MSRFPNASILFVLTFSSDKNEKLLMAYSKPVPDVAPAKPYWYPRRGQKGKASVLWPSLGLRQYLMIGADGYVSDLFDNLIQNKELVTDNRRIVVKVPGSYSLRRQEDDPYQGRAVGVRELYSSQDQDIPTELTAEMNISLLEGYERSTDQIIVPISPAGFLDNGFLYKNLKDAVFAIKEKRGTYITFRGFRGSNPDDASCYGIRGFMQNHNTGESVTASFIDENNLEQGQGKVGCYGLFSLTTKTSCDNGTLTLSDQLNPIYRKIPFVLLKNISFDVEVGEKNYTDLYQRRFTIENETLSPISAFVSRTWMRGVIISDELSSQRLSDHILDCFSYLGRDIIVYDPYFLGPIEKNALTGNIDLDFSQWAFVNAIVRAFLEKKVRKFEIVGTFSKSKSLPLSSTVDGMNKNERLIEVYSLLFENILVSSKKARSTLINFLKISRTLTSAFHNRYWIGYKTENGKRIAEKCLAVTNSIGNMDEVDFIPIEDEEQLRTIFAHVQRIFSDLKTEIKL